jgi:uncharacterized protein
VVTSDSLSMQMEIARLGRPLAIYPLPAASWFARRRSSPLSSGTAGRRPLPEARVGTIGRLCDAVAKRMAAIGRHRDLLAIPERLVRDGFAVWFGEPFRHDGRRPPDEVAHVAARIVALMKSHQTANESVALSVGVNSANRAAS